MVLLFALALLIQTPPDCADVRTCRQQAMDAAATGDYERFHDLAWRVVQKGRPNDPESMYMLARAQSLSGRPTDAYVMLDRLTEMRVATDAATNNDFERVRALKDWPTLEAKMAGRGNPVAVVAAARRTAHRRRPRLLRREILGTRARKPWPFRRLPSNPSASPTTSCPGASSSATATQAGSW